MGYNHLGQLCGVVVAVWSEKIGIRFAIKTIWRKTYATWFCLSIFQTDDILENHNMQKLQKSFSEPHTTTETTHMVQGQIITCTKQTQKQINKLIKYKKVFRLMITDARQFRKNIIACFFRQHKCENSQTTSPFDDTARKMRSIQFYLMVTMNFLSSDLQCQFFVNFERWQTGRCICFSIQSW